MILRVTKNWTFWKLHPRWKLFIMVHLCLHGNWGKTKHFQNTPFQLKWKNHTFVKCHDCLWCVVFAHVGADQQKSQWRPAKCHGRHSIFSRELVVWLQSAPNSVICLYKYLWTPIGNAWADTQNFAINSAHRWQNMKATHFSVAV